jgi:sugar/nucleoside kinase (ribokinase family)
MGANKAEVIAAGHICLDVIPTFRQGGSLTEILQPGKLIEVGAAVAATGGPVSNTGLTLKRLGFDVALMGKVGDDVFGNAIIEIVKSYGAEMAAGMIVAPGENSSYTVVINVPGVDRIFLHCPGANDTFTAADVNYDSLQGARLFHFGYPPLMKKMYEDGGVSCTEMFAKVKARGLTTSLDMAYPDPNSTAGKVDWVSWLKKVLPHVDVFLPSIEEILFMLDRAKFDSLSARATDRNIIPLIDNGLLRELSERMLAMGAAVVVIKLGERGLYLRTSGDASRLEKMGACAPQDSVAFAGHEIFSRCFKANLVGTTGSGDATIAGALGALLKGLGPEEIATYATAVGGCSVERAEAATGVPHWNRVEERIQAGWERL